MPEYLSLEGLEKLKKELDYLKNIKRKEIAKRLQECFSSEELTENSEYLEAKETQAILEGRILELEELIKTAEIISEKRQKNSVQIGSTILVSLDAKSSFCGSLGKRNHQKFKIVGAGEINPFEGKISADSPLGKAIINQPKGAEIFVDTPEGKIRYKILKID